MAELSNNKEYVTVEKGDTLSQIALDYAKESGGKTYSQLAAINKIPNPDLIYVGQRIYLVKQSSSSSGSSTFLSSYLAKIKHFGLQSDVENTLFVTWEWDRDNTDKYEVRWDYYTADKYWFVGSETSTKYKYSTYNIPSNARKVRVRVKPIAKTYKSGNKDVSYWSAIWTSWRIHTVENPPSKPSVPTVTIDGLKLTASLANLKDSPSIIYFEIVKDDKTTCNKGQATVKTNAASYAVNIAAGSKYKVRCRAYRDGLYSDWTEYSNNVDTIPSTPAKFTKCEPSTETSISLVWDSVTNATGYEIQYSTKQSNFDNADSEVKSITISENRANCEATGLESGTEYFFRVRAKNNIGTSGWSAVSSATIGTGPAAPTTWSSTTTAISGEPLTLYWVHNSKDGSSQTFAELEIIIDGEKETHTIENSTKEEEKDKTSSYSVKMVNDDGTPRYVEGAKILWRVRTAGIAKVYGEWSIQRQVDIYAPPTIELTVTNSDGDVFETLESFPFTVHALAGPNTQAPVGYHISITSNEMYDTVDNLGNQKIVNAGEEVFSKYYDISDVLETTISAGDLSLENGMSYTLKCMVSMNSGLTAESSIEFDVSWVELNYEPNAEISIDEDTYTAYIKPYCSSCASRIYKVNRSTSIFTTTTETVDGVYGNEVSGIFTTTGEQVYYGTSDEGEDIYYCFKYESIDVGDVLLSVYRREFDGTFTELVTGIDGSMNTTITDPHPALDYARYRIVAMSKDTGSVTYCDLPGYPVGGKSIIIQWDEEWKSFDVSDNTDVMSDSAWAGSILKLPYNVDISDNHKADVSLVEYIGRKHPVSYYGTHLGESSTWNVEIEKDDKETLYALRRLAIWMGDVYVREPSGSGYWAHISISFSQKHCELTIPVSINVARVEGGM